MTSPVSRLPLDATRLAILQQRPSPRPAEGPAAPALRERPNPPDPSHALGGTPRRGRLVDILA